MKAIHWMRREIRGKMKENEEKGGLKDKKGFLGLVHGFFQF